MKRTSNGRGFTLTEVLIVTVIVAVLASLTLPRFMGQPPRAELAEAINIINAIRRQTVTHLDFGSGTGLAVLGPGTTVANNAAWDNFGMRNPNLGSKLWNYNVAFTAAGPGVPVSFATIQVGRIGNLFGPTEQIIVTIAQDGTQTWTCVAPFQQVVGFTGSLTAIGCEY